MKLMMLVCFVPLPFIMAWMLANETKFKKNIVVGVTLPFEARGNTEVLKALGKYKKFTWLIAALLMLSAAACLLVTNDWMALQLLMYWVLPCIVLPYIPYVICNKELRRIKLQQGWGQKKAEKITVDTSAIPQIKGLSFLHFVLPLVLSLLPFLWEKDFVTVYLIDALVIIFMWLIYRFAYRNKAERVDGNVELTVALSVIRKKNWGRMFLAVSYFTAALNIIVSFTAASPVLFMAGTLVSTLLLICFVFATDMKTRKAQEKLCLDCGKTAFVDDDDKWLWGIFYYNPQDDKLVINSRIGTNSTFNLAKPAGKVIAALCLVLLLAVPFIIPVTNALGNKAPEYSLSETTLEARSGGVEYEIALEDIESAELLEKLPENLVKVSGTNFPDLFKGKFTAEDIGGLSVILDPTAPPYLIITENDGDIYLFGSREPGEIQSIYEEIK